MENHKPCETCGLIEKVSDGNHLTQMDCIRALRTAMFKQKQSAERIGMDISIHFLRALEELSIRPDVGFRYSIYVEGQHVELPPQQVSGVFASLLKVYREQSDFKDADAQREVTTHWAWVCGKLGGMLQTWLGRYDISEEDKLEAKALLEDIAANHLARPEIAELQEELREREALNVRLEAALAELADTYASAPTKKLMDEVRELLEPSEDQPDLSDS